MTVEFFNCSVFFLVTVLDFERREKVINVFTSHCKLQYFHFKIYFYFFVDSGRTIDVKDLRIVLQNLIVLVHFL